MLVAIAIVLAAGVGALLAPTPPPAQVHVTVQPPQPAPAAKPNVCDFYIRQADREDCYAEELKSASQDQEIEQDGQ